MTLANTAPPIDTAFHCQRIEGPLGNFHWAELRPRALAPWVDGLWYFEGRAAHRRERAMPNGLVEIILAFDRPHRLIEGVGDERCAAISVGGMFHRPIVVEAPEGSYAALGIRLRPLGALAVLGCPTHAIQGLTTSLRDVIGTAARSLEIGEENAGLVDADERRVGQRGADQGDVEERARQRLERARRWVARRLRIALAEKAAGDAAIAWAAGAVVESGGRIPIARLVEKLGWSKGRFVSRFREQIGLSPKLYARVIRFRRTVELFDLAARGPRPLSMAELAVDAGYYDQAHLCSELRTFAGLSPRQYFAADRYEASANLAESP